jgi:hypothetical protein
VSFRSRMKRLERERPDRGRCSACRGRSDHIVLTARQDSLDAPPVRTREHDEMGEPCLVCGWAPEVTEVIEIVVSDRDDATRALERGVWKVE